jgi:putative colanic acid biosynthesis acetyltransferase WcaB
VKEFLVNRRRKSMKWREWIFQDWSVNVGRPESQLLLAWFRLAQWAAAHWGVFGLVIAIHYWLISSQLLSIELPARLTVGPRLRLDHKHGIVINPGCTIGSDCHLRHGVTIGNKVDRDDNEIGIASVGNGVDFGAGCVVIGDIHVGDYARIGALAVVTKSVPAWGVAVGNPARIIRIDNPELQHSTQEFANPSASSA